LEEWYANDDDEEIQSSLNNDVDYSTGAVNDEGEDSDVILEVQEIPDEPFEIDQTSKAVDVPMPDTPSTNVLPKGRKRRLPSSTLGSKRDRTVNALAKKIKETSDANWSRMSSMLERMRKEDQKEREEMTTLMNTLTSVLERGNKDRQEERQAMREERLEERRAKDANMASLLSFMQAQQFNPATYYYNNHQFN
ncbi:uncharacterized protein LOC117110722, partial [Anneissia japonica]|uniref:uncharacterized protein LOC117110722 n=1 Tax=Anneissia japonica TaxID=1529436 RepID=UPI001425A9BE